MSEITVVFEDIFHQDVEAIVNPANKYMLHGGGLAKAIAIRGGDVLVQESQAQVPQEERGGIATGECIITGPGNLPFKAVIHVVGPVYDDQPAPWRQNTSDEEPAELLRRAHFSVIEMAAAHEITSVAFPAVSCGVFRYPVEEAAPIALEATRDALELFPSVERVVFCLLDESHFQAFEEAVDATE